MAAPSASVPRPCIDLTLDDDDDDNDVYRYAKRPREDSRPHYIPPPPPPQPPPQPQPQPYRPPFAGPSLLRQHPPPFSAQTQSIIDLTGSPSPPPPSISSRHAFQPPLPVDLPPKTPVCIGLLTVTALVVYQVPYIISQNPGVTEWVIVRLFYEHDPDKSTNKETIHIRTPSGSFPTGESTSSKGFAVVEQRVADFLGPILGKGLIRLDAKIRKSTGQVRQPHIYIQQWILIPSIKLPMLTLQMLVYTPKGNINVVGNYLHQSNLILSHPAPPHDMQRLTNYHYFNPHHGLQEAQQQAILAANPLNILTQQNQPRWSTPTSTTKSIEVQRSQVDELFRTLKDGDELLETEPGA